jgi:hypothetical protein
MFSPRNYTLRADFPHGQTIHVGPTSDLTRRSKCDKWVVLDRQAAFSLDYGKVIMNWRANADSTNVHWDWECDG